MPWPASPSGSYSAPLGGAGAVSCWTPGGVGRGLSFLPSGLDEPEVSAMEAAPRARLAFAPASAEVMLSRVPWAASCEGLSCSSEAPRAKASRGVLPGLPIVPAQMWEEAALHSVRGWSLRELCGVVCPATLPNWAPPAPFAVGVVFPLAHLANGRHGTERRQWLRGGSLPLLAPSTALLNGSVGD